MIWTMIVKEVDEDGDGVPDRVLVSGSNSVEKLSETIEGVPPEGFPPLPPPPSMTIPLDFEGVLDTGAADAPQ